MVLVRDEGRDIAADTDLRLCRFFGLSNGYWLRAQAAYDTEVAERVLAGTLRRIRPWVGHGGLSALKLPNHALLLPNATVFGSGRCAAASYWSVRSRTPVVRHIALASSQGWRFVYVCHILPLCLALTT